MVETAAEPSATFHPHAKSRIALGRVRHWTAAERFFALLVVIYIAKALLGVVVFPPFSGHDEVAHYAYLQTVATERRFPVLLEDRLPDELYIYCSFILQWDPCDPSNDSFLRLPPRAAIYPYGQGTHTVGLQYAANHPLLMYFLLTPAYWATESMSAVTQLYIFRTLLIPFGLMLVIFSYLLARMLSPRDSFLQVTLPAFVAFQPQLSYEASMLNNDIVCIGLYAALLYLLCRGLRDRVTPRLSVLTGVVFGMALLAKGTSLTAMPLIAMAVILGCGWRLPLGQRVENAGTFSRIRTGWLFNGAVIAFLGALIASPWYLHLYRTYGNLSGLPQVQEIQWWNYFGEEKPTISSLLFNKGFAALRWRETWGEFGWRRIHFSDSLLVAIGIPCVIGLVGAMVYSWSILGGRPLHRDDPHIRPARWQKQAFMLLTTASVIGYMAVVQFGTQFELTQARYYFPVLLAAGTVLLVGIRTLVGPRHLWFWRTLIVTALVLMNVLVYAQYVIPYWHMGKNNG